MKLMLDENLRGLKSAMCGGRVLLPPLGLTDEGLKHESLFDAMPFDYDVIVVEDIRG